MVVVSPARHPDYSTVSTTLHRFHHLHRAINVSVPGSARTRVQDDDLRHFVELVIELSCDMIQGATIIPSIWGTSSTTVGLPGAQHVRGKRLLEKFPKNLLASYGVVALRPEAVNYKSAHDGSHCCGHVRQICPSHLSSPQAHHIKWAQVCSARV